MLGKGLSVAMQGYLPFEHLSFRLKFLFLFPLVTAKFIGDYFDIELFGANCSCVNIFTRYNL
jgi:hypothetical protein